MRLAQTLPLLSIEEHDDEVADTAACSPYGEDKLSEARPRETRAHRVRTPRAHAPRVRICARTYPGRASRFGLVDRL